MLAGAIAMASMIVSLFFLRFWRSTHDRFFLFFAISFFLDAWDRTLLGSTTLPSENAPIYCFIRLIAYLLILYAIVDKNRRTK